MPFAAITTAHLAGIDLINSRNVSSLIVFQASITAERNRSYDSFPG